MKTQAEKKTTSTRYTDAQKERILGFIEKYNKKNGYGGLTQAMRKFNVSQTAIISWGHKNTRATPGKGTIAPNAVIIKKIKNMNTMLWKLINKL